MRWTAGLIFKFELCLELSVGLRLQWSCELSFKLSLKVDFERNFAEGWVEFKFSVLR